MQEQSSGVTQSLTEKPGVLVVDDDRLVRILLQLGLERNGFEVWVASNGREANDLYRKHCQRISVVLLDVCMPGLDGPQTLDALRKHNPELRACFMTGNPGNYELDELLQFGAKRVFSKPFMLDELANTLKLLAHGIPVDLLPLDSPRHPGANTPLN